jgi:ABC-type uncharacterized transport system involved in gliding motility auxiliary subunit
MTTSTQALRQQVAQQPRSVRPKRDWEKIGHGIQLMGCSLTLLVWVVVPMLVVLALLVYAVGCSK